MIKISHILQDFYKSNDIWNDVYSILVDDYNYFFNKIINLRNFFIPERTPYPYDLAKYVGAYIVTNDSDNTLRIKAESAISLHKKYAMFKAIWKPFIDNVLGGDCNIVDYKLYYGSFIVGSSIIGSPAIIGDISVVNGVKEIPPEGIIHIDLNITPTQDQLNALIAYLIMLVPAYIVVYLGVTTTIDAKAFVVGDSIIGDIDTIGINPDPVIQFNVLGRL